MNDILFENIMDRDVFVEILSNYFISRANELYELDYLIHEDNDPKHTSGPFIFCCIITPVFSINGILINESSG